jgi:hypothetical protein
MKLPFVSIFALLFGLSGLHALKLCEEITFGCPGGDWYTECYGDGELGCKASFVDFGTGQAGVVNDCGCGSYMKIKWRCSDTEGATNSSGHPSTSSGAACWCRLDNLNTVAGSWVFYNTIGNSQFSACLMMCAPNCARAVAQDSAFRAALCTPAAAE